MIFDATQIQTYAASFVRPVELDETRASKVATLLVNKQGKVTGGMAKAEKIADAAGISLGAAKHIIEQAKAVEYAHAGGTSKTAAQAREERIFTTQDSSGRKTARKR